MSVKGRSNNKKDKTDNMKTSSAGVSETRARSIQHPTCRRQDEKVISVSICLRIFHFPCRLPPYHPFSAHSRLLWKRTKLGVCHESRISQN